MKDDICIHCRFYRKKVLSVKEFNEDGSITECPYWEAKE